MSWSLRGLALLVVGSSASFSPQGVKQVASLAEKIKNTFVPPPQ